MKNATKRNKARARQIVAFREINLTIPAAEGGRPGYAVGPWMPVTTLSVLPSPGLPIVVSLPYQRPDGVAETKVGDSILHLTKDSE